MIDVTSENVRSESGAGRRRRSALPMLLLALAIGSIVPAGWAQVRYRPLSSYDDQPTRAERLRDLRSAPVEIVLDGERNDQLVLRRGGQYFVAEPLYSPDGEELVAVVNELFMTRPELMERLNFQLRNFEPIHHPDPRRLRQLMDERRRELTEKLLQDWLESKVLAIDAARRGYTVTDREVSEALRIVSEAGASATAAASAGAAPLAQPSGRPSVLMGVAEDQLRAEIHDSLLIEKYIDEMMEINYREADFRRVYRADPQAFLLSPRVRVFHIFRMVDPYKTEQEQKAARKEIASLRRALKKRKPDLAALAARSNGARDLAIGDMGWVTVETPISLPLKQQVFKLDVGKTSDVIKDETGLHVVRILDREEGSAFTFEAARPRIENYLFAKMKHLTFEKIRPDYEIQSVSFEEVQESSGAVGHRTHGVRQWREISQEEFDRIGRMQGGKVARSRRPGAGRTGAAASPRPGDSPTSVSSPPQSAAPAIDLRVLDSPPKKEKN